MRKNDPTKLLAQYEAIWANAVVGVTTTTTEDNESVRHDDTDSSENSIFVSRTTTNAARDSSRMNKADQQDVVEKVSDGEQ